MSNLYVNNISPATGNTVTVSGSQGLIVSGSAIITGDLTVTGTFDANVLDFKVTANTMTFGDAASDTLTFNAATASVANGLNFDSNTLVIDSANNRIGIGAQHPATKLHVSGNVTVEGAEGGAATILLKADQSDDAGDDWTVVANADHTFTIGNDIASAGSSVAHVTITPNSTVTNSVTALAGKLKVGGNVIQASDGGATMTLDTNDNVTFAGGIIGTTFSGSSTLHSVGAATFGSTIASTGSITAGGGVLSTTISGSGALNIVGAANFGPGNATVIAADGGLTIDHFDANWTNAGNTVANLGTVTTVDINGGSVDGATIGAAAQSTIKATTFSGSSTLHSVGAATFGSTIASTGSVTAGGLLTTTFSGSSTLQSVGAAVFGGALNVSGAVTVGVNDVGSDVRIFSATNNEGVLYDASEDELALLLTTKLKFHDVGGGEEIFASSNGHLEVNSGTTLDMTAPTIDINASTAVTIDGPAVTIADSAEGKPVLTLKTTHTTEGSSGELQFLKDAADTEDGEVLGQITFYGEDEGNNNTMFAKIVAQISESDETDEAGKLSFFVAESDGTNTALTAGLVLEGEHATDGEIDVTIAAGASSTTTVAGSIQVTTGIELGHASDTTITRTGSGAIAVEGTAVLLAGAQTAITTDFNAGRKVGRDAHNLIDFSTDDKVTFRVANVDEIALEANEFSPTTNDGIALGSSSKGWSDLFLADAGTIQFGNDQDITLTHIPDSGLVLASTGSTFPLLQLKNTTNDTNGARLRFVKDKGAAGADNDEIGIIEFYGDDDNQDQVLFAAIQARVADASNSEEGGQIRLGVAAHDGELNYGLTLTDGDSEDEIDVEIGKKSGSMTTIKGSLTVTSTTVYTPLSTHNFTGNDTGAAIPITATYVRIDAAGSSRTGMRFGGAGTAGQFLIVENAGGENVTFHATGGTALTATNTDNDTIMPGEIVTFVSNGSAWFLTGGDLQAG